MIPTAKEKGVHCFDFNNIFFSEVCCIVLIIALYIKLNRRVGCRMVVVFGCGFGVGAEVFFERKGFSLFSSFCLCKYPN